jgi:predicted LPLAT superfamily acyltransferase
VARGEFVAIAGDRIPVSASASTTTRVPFLGHDAPLPVGPYVLAALLKCPLYLLVCLREPGGHVMHFERLAERVELPRAARGRALQAHAAHFAQRLEQRLAASPYEWFNFYPFWDQPIARTDHDRP